MPYLRGAGRALHTFKRADQLSAQLDHSLSAGRKWTKQPAVDENLDSVEKLLTKLGLNDYLDAFEAYNQ